MLKYYADLWIVHQVFIRKTGIKLMAANLSMTKCNKTPKFLPTEAIQLIQTSSRNHQGKYVHMVFLMGPSTENRTSPAALGPTQDTNGQHTNPQGWQLRAAKSRGSQFFFFKTKTDSSYKAGSFSKTEPCTSFPLSGDQGSQSIVKPRSGGGGRQEYNRIWTAVWGQSFCYTWEEGERGMRQLEESGGHLLTPWKVATESDSLGFFVVLLCLFEKGISPCSPGWPGIHSIAQLGWHQTYKSSCLSLPSTTTSSFRVNFYKLYFYLDI